MVKTGDELPLRTAAVVSLRDRKDFLGHYGFCVAIATLSFTVVILAILLLTPGLGSTDLVAWPNAWPAPLRVFLAMLAVAALAANLAISASRERRIARLRAELASAGDALASEESKRTIDAKQLARGNALLEAVANSANEMIESHDSGRSYAKILELVGNAAGADVAWLAQAHRAANAGGIVFSTLVDWLKPGFVLKDELKRMRRLDLSEAGLGAWNERLAGGKPIAETIANLPDAQAAMFRKAGIRSVAAVPILDAGRLWGVVGLADYTEDRIWTEDELRALRILAELVGNALGRARAQAELLTAGRIIENSPTVLFRVGASDTVPLLYISENIARYGYRAAELLGAPRAWQRLFHPEDLPGIKADVEDMRASRAGKSHREMRFRKSDGSWVWFDGWLTAIRDPAGDVTALEGVLSDITERKVGEDLVAYLARHDALTGLANRSAFMERLEEEFAAARRDASLFAVLYVDLDHFKDFNDAFDHAKGDLLLRAVAQRLDGMLRQNDKVARFGVARFGGDEFAVLQTGLSDAADAGALAARINKLLAQPYVIDGGEFHVTASVGISLYEPSLTKPEEMVARADLALYRAKDEGRNQFRFHTKDLDESVRERFSIAEDLHDALERNQLELYYQPQVEAASGKIFGLEALIRWNHPVRGLVMPANFIPIAEKTGIILALDRWILETACRQVAAWRAEGLATPRVSVNVSGAEFRASPNFDRHVSELLRKNKLEPSALEIEITETALVETSAAHSDILLRLRRLGLNLAIDDFGTGYSSLEYLRAYPVNRLKIAQQFLRDLPDNEGNAAIIRATIGLARALDIDVIAEGVETGEQLRFLLNAGCHDVQGFYFSPPVPIAKAAELIRQGVIPPREAAA